MRDCSVLGVDAYDQGPMAHRGIVVGSSPEASSAAARSDRAVDISREEVAMKGGLKQCGGLVGWVASLAIAALALGPVDTALGQTDPLPSWNERPVKQSILKFVQAATDSAGPQQVPPAARIAVFDNDGTLWSEQPMYFQGFFAFDRVKALAPKHPEWKTKQPFKGILENDMKAVAAAGEKGLVEVVMATHAGMTTDEFERIVKDWLAQAKHPRFQRPYTELIYQPMLELLAYLRASGFKTYIVSGGGVDFMRVFTEQVYGIPPEQVVGTVIETK